MQIIPFDKRDGHIWYNGEIIPWQDAKIHVLNHGLHYGSCVFEGIAVYNEKIFKLREHSQRLIDSAKLLDFDLPYSLEELEQATKDIVKKQNIKERGYIRPFAWRGSEKMAIAARENKIHVAIATWVWPPYFGKGAKEKGLDLVFAKYSRPAPHTAPTASKAAGLYMICTYSKHVAERNGYNDAMMLDWQGNIAEATCANMFFIINDELHTPTADCFLNGITRLTVIDLAKKRGIKIVERKIKPEELAETQDAFLTGTTVEITRVNSIEKEDKSEKFNFEPHQITLDLMEDYQNLILK